ncbi:MAG: glycosyltransferase [Candidatus Marinimicrobia bacterium]|nr:glycosyltransferase [Candidatus Neomarinimicrobiota bacterium]
MTVFYFFGIIILSILIKIPYCKVPLDADYGIYGYHGLFWLRKQKLPVQDTKENHPPGRWMLYALLLKYFKVSRSLFRFSAIFFLTITQISIFVITESIAGEKIALLSTAFYGILVSLPTFVWVQSNDEIEQSAFTALALALVFRSPEMGSWVFFLVGLVAFLSLFFKQSAYINTFPVVLFSIILYKFSFSNVLLFAAGATLGLVVTGIYHYQAGIFHFFIDIFSLNIKALKMHLDNILYGNKKLVRYKEYDGEIPVENKEYIDGQNRGFQSRQKIWARILYGKFFRQTMVFMAFTPFVFLYDTSTGFYKPLIILVLWLSSGLFTVHINKHIMPYHFLPLAAPMAIFSGIGVFTMYSHFTLWLSLPLFLMILGCSAFIARREIQETVKREKVQRGLMYVNHPSEWLFFTIGEEIGKSLREVTHEGDQIYVWGAQYEIYLWAERPSPTWSLFCPHPSVAGYVVTPFLDEELILQGVVPNPPKYIVIAAETKGFDRFRDFLFTNYYRVQGQDDEVQIYRWILADILPISFKEFHSLKTQITDDKEFDKKLEIRRLEEYEAKGESRQVMDSLYRIWLVNPDDPYISKKVGEITLYNKIYDQSEKLLTKYLVLNPHDHEIFKPLGKALFFQQKFEEAKLSFESYLIENDDDGVLEFLMDLYFFIQRKSEAAYFARHLYRKNPTNEQIALKKTRIENSPILNFDKVNSSINIKWEGSQFVNHSLALVNREHCLRLAKAGFNLSIIPYEKDQFKPEGEYRLLQKFKNKELNETDIHLYHRWPPKLTAPKNGHWVIIQPWEFGYLPKNWVTVFNEKVDEMWVPSTYVKQVYLDSGVDPERVFVVPNGVDTQKFNPLAKPYRLKTRKKFKFLFVGGTIYRKGIDILLKSYINTFTKNDDVCLVIKDFGGQSFYKDQTFKKEIADLMQQKNIPEIEYISDTLSDTDLIGLYTACNLLVHPYRGEGFGLPILEAMACGIPTMVTKGGAALDFCNSRTTLFIKAKKLSHEFKIVGEKELVDFPWFWEADTADLCEKMAYAARNSQQLLEMGKFASAYVKKNWDWNIASFILQKRIQKLIRKPILRFQKDLKEVIQSVDNVNLNAELELMARDYLKKFTLSKLPFNLLGHFLCQKKLKNDLLTRKYLPELEILFSDNYMILNILAISWFEKGDLKKAGELLQKSLQFNEDSLDTRRNYAEILIMNEQYEEGLKQFLNVIERNLHDTNALLRMAQLNLEVGRLEDAANYVWKILEYDPENQLALQLKRMIKTNQENDE